MVNTANVGEKFSEFKIFRLTNNFPSYVKYVIPNLYFIFVRMNFLYFSIPWFYFVRNKTVILFEIRFVS